MSDKKGSWVVRMKCEVIKEVICGGCTEEEAEEFPHDHAVGDEEEIEQESYEVISVKPNN